MKSKASKGQVDNLSIEVQKLKGQIKTLNQDENQKGTRRSRNKRGGRASRRSNGNSFGIASRDPVADGLGRKRRDYNLLWNDYLNALLDFTIPNAFIPDLNFFPFTTAQARTVIQITPSSAGTFSLILTPAFDFCGEIADGVSPAPTTRAVATVNGRSYSTAGVSEFENSIFGGGSIRVSDQWRIVSMGVRVTYEGSMLTAKGRLATACVPPSNTIAFYDTYTELANYNYSFTGAAKEGATQCWFPGGSRSREFLLVDSTLSPTTIDYLEIFPGIAISADGLETGAGTIINVELTQNYEIVSTNQLLTAHKRRASQVKMDHAASTMSRVYASNGGGHAGSTKKDHTPWWKTALSIGKDVAEVALPLAATMLL